MASGGFDEDRFREAVAYIAWQMRDDPEFGRVKVAKTLFYADFECFAEQAEPLTGARYEHWPFGPYPPVLYRVEQELMSTGQAELHEAEHTGDVDKLLLKRRPDTPHLADWHRLMLDMKMRELAEQPTWKVSDESHEHPGWALTDDREEIPYEAALVPGRPSRAAWGAGRQRFAEEERPF
jgi:uncharacterized phage-associated protein